MGEKKILDLNIPSFKIEGYTCTVEYVTTNEPDGIWRKSPQLVFSIAFEPHVPGAISTGIYLPVAEYSKDELTTLIKDKTREAIFRLIQEDSSRRVEQEKKKSERESLDSYAERIKSILEG